MLTASDWISLSRLPLSVGVVISFDRETDGAQWVVIGLVAIAAATDIIDGRLARARNQASLRGYILDGLGDKAIYTSLYIVMLLDDFISIFLCHLLILREIALYAFRCLALESDTLNRYRKYSLLHAMLIRASFVTFFSTGFTVDDQLLDLAGTSLATGAVVVGLVGLVLSASKANDQA